MPITKTIRVGKRGTLVLPAPLRRRFGLEEDALVIVELHDQGLLLRPAVAVPCRRPCGPKIGRKRSHRLNAYRRPRTSEIACMA